MKSNTAIVLALCYLLSFTWVVQYAEAAHIEKLAALALVLRALQGGNKGQGVKFIPVYVGGHHQEKKKKKEQEIKIIHLGGHGGGMMESMGHMGGEEMMGGGGGSSTGGWESSGWW